MQYLLGVDLGTSGTKTVLFDTDGNVICAKSQGYPMQQPKNGWAEQDPEDWYQATVATVSGVLRQSGVSAADIAGMGISGQMHGLVMLDSEGRVLRPSILWCDARTGEQCAEIHRLVGKSRLIDITANPALPGFTASKILWVREHEPEIYARCAAILLPKDYVRYRLTGRLMMEISDASGTNLLDITSRCWSEEILRDLSIDKSLLPPLVESAQDAGGITAEAAAATGLTAGMPVAGGAADNCASAVGTGVCAAGQAFITLGTSGVIFAHSERPAVDPLGRVHTFCSAVPGAWTVMSCTLAAGQSLRWARDVMYGAEKETCARGGQDIYDLMTGEAGKAPAGSDGLLFLPYLMGERSPVLDPEARGIFFGLSARHGREHMTRAVLEGITLSQRHNLHVLREMGLVPTTLTACGGGAASPFWRQLLADILGTKVALTQSTEGGALGAAVLAGVAAGVFPTVEEGCRRCVRPGSQSSEPNAALQPVYDEVYALYQSLYPLLRGSYARLARLRSTLEGSGHSRYPSVYDPAFERYGKIIGGVDTKAVIERLKLTPLPESGVAYVPSVPELETPELMADIEKRVFGGLKVQMGYCSGHNRVLNALEYHRNAELNIAEADCLVMVAPIGAVLDGVADTEAVETFFVPAGTALWFYETTLHYAPCTMDGQKYFRMCVVLPKDTNTGRPAGVCREGEAAFLTHNNKWLFAHADSPEARSGLTPGRLVGQNLDLDHLQNW